MKKTISVFIALAIFNLSYGQKLFSQRLFDDYNTLNNPLNDSAIIGKLFSKGVFSGHGVPKTAFEIHSGLESIATVDTLGWHNKFQVEVEKIVSGKIELDNGSTRTCNFGDVQVFTCTDYSKLDLSSNVFSSSINVRNPTPPTGHVVSAIAVCSFDVISSKLFDDSLKVDLAKEITGNLKVVPVISYQGKKASVRINNGFLIVAIKMIRIANENTWYRTISITNDNSKSYLDKHTGKIFRRKLVTLRLKSMTTMDSIFTTDSAIYANKGCLYLSFTNPVLELSHQTGEVIIAPLFSRMGGTIKPPDSTYTPNPDYITTTLEPILGGRVENGIVIYSVKVSNLSVVYEGSPTHKTRSNYRIGSATADVIVATTFYRYRYIR